MVRLTFPILQKDSFVSTVQYIQGLFFSFSLNIADNFFFFAILLNTAKNIMNSNETEISFSFFLLVQKRPKVEDIVPVTVLLNKQCLEF